MDQLKLNLDDVVKELHREHQAAGRQGTFRTTMEVAFDTEYLEADTSLFVDGCKFKKGGSEKKWGTETLLQGVGPCSLLPEHNYLAVYAVGVRFTRDGRRVPWHDTRLESVLESGYVQVRIAPSWLGTYPFWLFRDDDPVSLVYPVLVRPDPERRPLAVFASCPGAEAPEDVKVTVSMWGVRVHSFPGPPKSGTVVAADD